MIPLDITDGIENLINVRYAFLRIVAFITDGRESGNGDETKAGVARTRRDNRQANIRIQHAALLRYRRRYPAEGQTSFIDQFRTRHKRESRHYVLTASFDCVRESGTC